MWASHFLEGLLNKLISIIIIVRPIKLNTSNWVLQQSLVELSAQIKCISSAKCNCTWYPTYQLSVRNKIFTYDISKSYCGWNGKPHYFDNRHIQDIGMLCVQSAAPSLPLPASNLTGSKSNKEHLRRTLPLWIERTMGVLNSFILWVYYISAQCQFNHYGASHNVKMKYTFKGPHELRVSARMVLRFELKDVYWKQVDGQAGIILCCLLIKECTL